MNVRCKNVDKTFQKAKITSSKVLVFKKLQSNDFYIFIHETLFKAIDRQLRIVAIKLNSRQQVS